MSDLRWGKHARNIARVRRLGSLWTVNEEGLDALGGKDLEESGLSLLDQTKMKGAHAKLDDRTVERDLDGDAGRWGRNVTGARIGPAQS